MSKRNFSAVNMDDGDDTPISSSTSCLTMDQMAALLNKTISRLNSVEEQLVNIESEISDLKKENEILKKDNLSLHKRNAAEDERNLSTYFSIKTLGDNVEWTYNAPIPPSSYWHELGFDAEYIEDLNEYIIERIKDVRLRIRRGQCQDEIDIDLGTVNLHTQLFTMIRSVYIGKN